MSEALLSDLDRRVLNYVRAVPGKTAAGIADALGEDYHQVYASLGRLQRKGLVKRVRIAGGRKARTRYFEVWEPQRERLWLYQSEVDLRTCDLCLRYNGEIFNEEELAEIFPFLRRTGRFIWRPHVHPNCRCFLKLIIGGA